MMDILLDIDNIIEVGFAAAAWAFFLLIIIIIAIKQDLSSAVKEGEKKAVEEMTQRGAGEIMGIISVRKVDTEKEVKWDVYIDEILWTTVSFPREIAWEMESSAIKRGITMDEWFAEAMLRHLVNVERFIMKEQVKE